MHGINVIRLAKIPTPRTIPFVRALDHFSEAFLYFLGGLLSGKQDVVLIYSPPLTLGISGYFLKRIKRMPFFFNMQDVYPQTLIDIGILKNPIFIKFFRAIERWVYKRLDFATVYSEGNRQYLLSMGVPESKVLIIANWVDTDLIKPSGKFNSFRRQYGIKEQFVVSFAGVMGYAQGLDTVVKAASLLREHEDILFLLVGDGVEKPELETLAHSLNLDNVMFLPMQPRDRYPEVLAASDICLVTLKGSLKTAVPGKLVSIMASGRPVVASLDLAGETPKVIKAADCGFCVESGNAEGLSKAILDLYENPDLRDRFGSNARDYAVKHFSRTSCTRKYEMAFLNSLSKRKRQSLTD